ncbi:hypothetical protein DICSQDRAFT_170053 [Dichomitus squalens LYAD-421 SS1]|uniref:Uncharacterized protein n=1 Tax=Dichomitus squalens (strain LYAD-421) TaxID=732165 RepID=R7T2K8_DICSQ|nr:uncharacterized protein DICSQDRAFT_170053 [Dichomitus squalens LYAD-421 SS1]EJF61637.1 hypothetical protein DICSQDRAFT_170053 [Dichomitus squalens LYAD-421 SS1]
MDSPPAIGLDTEDAGDDSDEESLKELEGNELFRSLEAATKSAYAELMKLKTKQQWKQGESELKGVYTGRAAQTLDDHRLKANAKAATDAVIRNSYEAERFRSFFKRNRSSTEETLPSSPKKCARVAAATALQASDTVFARIQILINSGL